MSGQAVFEIGKWTDRQTDKQTDRDTSTAVLWPWLDLPLTTVKYFMHFGFVDDVMF